MKFIAKWQKKKPEIDYFDFECENILDELKFINGITDLSEWLEPTIKNTYDPYLLDNIESACRRIVQAIENNEKICVSYDSDCKMLQSLNLVNCWKTLKLYTLQRSW